MSFTNRILMILVLLIFVGVMPSASQTLDSSGVHKDTTMIQHSSDYSLYEENDFTPGLAIYAAMVAIAVVICIVIGAILVALGILMFFLLLALGIITTAVLVGIKQRSLYNGFRTFLLLTFGIGGSFIGSIVFFVVGKILHWPLTNLLISGAIGGLIGGISLGWMISIIIKKISEIAVKKHN